MSKSKAKKPVTRVRRSEAFRQEALKLAQEVGVAKAAKEPGIYDSQIYEWRRKAAAQVNRSERESEL